MKDKVCLISCTKEVFESIKSDERFIGLLNLARFINALRFCQKPIINIENNSQSFNDGVYLNSFLFTSSLLYEGFKLVKKFNKNIKSLDSFKNGFQCLIEDTTVMDLIESIRKKMRNKFVFHFDDRVMKKSLQTFDIPTIKFASRCENGTGGTYFDLADKIVMNYLLQRKENESNKSWMHRFDQIVKNTCTIMDKFNKATIMLMAEIMEDMPFFKTNFE